MDKKNVWRTVNSATHEISTGTRRLFRVMKQKWRSKRGKRETVVKEIYISPEGDEERWASRSASSSSRASSSTTNCSSSTENTILHVVHDMNDEYDLEYR